MEQVWPDAPSTPQATSQGVPLAVLDFRRHSNVPNPLGAKQQRRVLVLLGLAALVTLLVVQAGDRRKGRWFAGIVSADGEKRTTRAVEVESAAAKDRQPPVNDDERDRAPIDRNALFPGVRRDYLSEVRDDEVFRAAESDAWFHLLAILGKTSQRELENASLGRVGFRQLDQQADEYRGRLVTIQGIVRGAKLVSAPENGFGINEYYQLWLQADRASPKLLVVYALKLPEGFPLGTRLDAASRTTGFFFKRWAYHAQGGVTTAPLILARTVAWQPPGPAPPEAPRAEQFVWALVVALILAVLIVGFLVSRRRGPLRHRHSSADSERVRAVLASREIADRVDRGDGAAADKV